MLPLSAFRLAGPHARVECDVTGGELPRTVGQPGERYSIAPSARRDTRRTSAEWVWCRPASENSSRPNRPKRRSGPSSLVPKAWTSHGQRAKLADRKSDVEGKSRAAG